MAENPLPERIGLLLADDFLWISRITGTAQALGLKVHSARSVDQLVELCAKLKPSWVILDLETIKPRIADAIARVQAACTPPPRFMAFGSHVDVASLRAAREAGCDPVLPRSKMAEDLPALLREWLG